MQGRLSGGASQQSARGRGGGAEGRAAKKTGTREGSQRVFGYMGTLAKRDYLVGHDLLGRSWV